MIRLFLTFTVLAASALPHLLFAQSVTNHDEDLTQVIVNGETASNKDVEKSFRHIAPQSPNDNGLPRFAIVGKDREFYLGIGAQFLGEATFDWGDALSTPTLFIPSAIAPSTPGNRSNLGFGWQTSSFYLNFVALPHTNNQLGLFFKANFTGNNNNFSVFHFYSRYRGLTAGYTYSLFYDGAAEPTTIDFQGPNGYPCATLFTAYWSQRLTAHLSAAIGIDAPTISLSTGNSTGVVNQRIPAVPLYIQYGWNEDASHVRLSGLARCMQYRDMIAKRNRLLTGLGVQLSAVSKIAGPLSGNLNITYGKGIASYIQDDQGLNLDGTATTEPGRMQATKTLGFTAGLSCSLTSKLQANAVFSHAANWLGSEGVISGDQYRYGDYAAANMIYTISRFVSAGIEYDYGRRRSFDGSSLHTNRFQCQLAVTF